MRALLKITKLGGRTAASAVRIGEDVRDWDSKKLEAQATAREAAAEAARAERTLDAQVEADQERLRLENERLRLENDRLSIENDRSRDGRDYERLVRQLMLSAASRGDLVLAETYRQQLSPDDVALLRVLSQSDAHIELASVENDADH